MNIAVTACYIRRLLRKKRPISAFLSYPTLFELLDEVIYPSQPEAAIIGSLGYFYILFRKIRHCRSPPKSDRPTKQIKLWRKTICQ